MSRRIACRPRPPRTATSRQRQSRAGALFPFCTAECRPWPAGIVASLSEPEGRVSTRPAGRGRSEDTGVAGGAAGGASLVTFWSTQESNSPAGASPGQSPSIGGTRRNEQQRTKPWTPASAGATNQKIHATTDPILGAAHHPRQPARTAIPTARMRWRVSPRQNFMFVPEHWAQVALHSPTRTTSTSCPR